MKKGIEQQVVKPQYDQSRSFVLFGFYILHFTFFIFLLSSCYEPREGCLDISATNFQVDADDPCPDCCTYPQIRMDFLHRVVQQDTFFNLTYLDAVYIDSDGNPYTIGDIQFFISNFRIVDQAGQEYRTEDFLEISIPVPDDEPKLDTISNSFALIDAGNFRTAMLGTFSRAGTYHKVRFTLGVENPANQADPGELPEDHPLTTPEMYWSLDSGYVFNRIELYTDTTAADTIPTIVEIGGLGNSREVELDFDQTFQLDNGFNLSLTLQVDYAVWFRDINVVEDDATEMAGKIVNQVAESFSLIAVEPE